MTGRDSATRILIEFADGDRLAAEDLSRRVFEELRTIAGWHLRHQRLSRTLQAESLMNEACHRLFDPSRLTRTTKVKFRALASAMMRRILVEHLRKRQEAGEVDRNLITVQDANDRTSGKTVDLLDLDEALTELSSIHRRPARVVELRYFGGLSTDDAATELGISSDEVQDDWDFARAWLKTRLNDGSSAGDMV